MNEALSKRLKQYSVASPAHEALLSLLLAANRMNESFDVVCEEHGITRPQYNLLRILRGVHPKGHPRREIACRMLERAPDVTRLVDRLETRGLVRRKRGNEDQRQAMTCITRKGLKLLESMQPAMDDLLTACFKRLSLSDCQELTRICAYIFACEPAPGEPRPPQPMAGGGHEGR